MVAAVILAAALLPQDASLNDVLEHMHQRLLVDAQRQVSGARWIKERTDTDMRDPEHPRPLHTDQYEVWGDGTRMLQRKVMRDGKPKNEKVSPLAFFVDSALMNRFDFSFGTPRLIQDGDHEYWHLVFKPRVGAPEGDDLEQKIIGASTGIVLLDAETLGIERVHAETDHPLPSLLVDVNWWRVTIYQELIDGTWMTRRINIEVSYDPIIGGAKKERHRYEYRDIVLPLHEATP